MNTKPNLMRAGMKTIESPKDKRWYAFRWRCDFHVHTSCNMYSDEEMHGCIRPDRKGNPRKEYDRALCKVNVCPLLKGKLPMSEEQKGLLNER